MTRTQKEKVRKTDESVEICRKQANRDKKTLWMACECHLQGFLMFYVAKGN